MPRLDSNFSSHCSSIEEKLERYGCHALNESEHLGLIIGNETVGSELIQHFGSISALSQASLQQLRAFLPRTKALRLIVALRTAAVALRQDSVSDPLDSPEKIAALCSEGV
jgi:DNA repair proteins